MLTAKQIEMINTAEYVLVDENSDIIFVWYGGQYISKFHPSGELIDSWCIALPKGRYCPTLAEVIESVDKEVKEVQKELSFEDTERPMF